MALSHRIHTTARGLAVRYSARVPAPAQLDDQLLALLIGHHPGKGVLWRGCRQSSLWLASVEVATSGSSYATPTLERLALFWSPPALGRRERGCGRSLRGAAPRHFPKMA